MSLAERQKQVTSSLNSGNKTGTLKAIVSSPVYNADEATRNQDIQLTSQALSGFKTDKDIEAALAGISDEELDVLFKYLYACLTTGDAGKELLQWHALALKRAGGLGPIVRVLTDKANKI